MYSLPDQDLLALSALLAEGAVSAAELVEACLAQIAAVDPLVMAVVDLDEDSARAQAARADRRRALGDRSRLLGIPLLVKNVIDVEGFVTRAGTCCPWQRAASRDAEAVSALRSAGVITLAITTTHQFAYGGLTPPTRNPWNLGHVPGGSSGGSAAGVSAGMAPAALGTDTLGSIRAPAAFCGVVGLKPTTGAVSTAGVVPLASTQDTVGPIASTAAGCAALLRAMTPASRRGRRGSRIGVVPVSPLALSVRAAMTRVTDQLATCFTLDEAEIGDLAQVHQAASTVLAVEATALHRRHLAAHPGCYNAVIAGRVRAGEDLAIDQLRAAWRTRAALIERLDALLTEWDALLLPTAVDTAPVIGVGSTRSVAGTELPLGTSMTLTSAPFSLSGHPAVTLPVGLDERGLPIGAQLVGRRGEDLHLLDLADRVHQVVGRLGSPSLTTLPAAT